MADINLNINDGKTRITINGDKNRAIYVDLSDTGIFSRALQAQNDILAYVEKVQKNATDDVPENKMETIEKNIALINDVEQYARGRVNYIFNDDICQTVFGEANITSICDDGRTKLEIFLEAIMPVIDKAMGGSSKKGKQRIKKYADKYATTATRQFLEKLR